MPSCLIIKPSSLGDIIHGLQVAQSIKEQLPTATIDWVVRDRFAPIVTNCNTVDNILIYHRKKGFGPFVELIKEIRQKHYDYVLDFQGLARTGIMTLFARATHKLGRSDARECSTLAYQKKAPLPKHGKKSHAVDILLQFLPLMGLKPTLLGELTYNVPKYLPKDTHPIVIIPNSRQGRKEWQGFAALTKLLLAHYPNETVLWDSHVKTETPAEFKDNPHFINTTGKTGVPEMISIISSARLVIANDSGPMHLAAAMKKPVLGLFGPTPPERFAPYPLDNKTNFAIQAPNNDLQELTPEDVFNKVTQILA